MGFAGLGERDVEGSEVFDWPRAGDEVEAAGVGSVDELVFLLVLGRCIASSTPLLTSSWTVSVAEDLPIRSTTPS